jgi:ribonucleoside-triphosphate reductase
MEIILFKSTTCPQCKVAKTKLDAAGIEYREELDMAVMEQYGVKTIPTLYIDGTKITKLSEINKWINEQVGKNNG